MRRATWVLGLGFAAFGGCSGAGQSCRSAELEPVPPSTSPRFAVLAVDDRRSRLEISLLDANGTPIEWPDRDGRGAVGSVWLTHATPLPGTGLSGGIGPDATLPWTPSEHEGLFVLTPRGGRTIVWIPFRAQPGASEVGPIGEVVTEPASRGRNDAVGGEVLDVVRFAGTPDPDDGIGDRLLVLRSAGVAGETRFGEDLMLVDIERPGAPVLARLSFSAALAGPATPRRMAVLEDPRRDGTSHRVLIAADRVLPPAVPGEPPQFGPGTILVVDRDLRRVVRVLEIPQMRRCGEIAVIPGAPTVEGGRITVSLIAACAGIDGAHGELGTSAGMVLLRVTYDETNPAAEPVIAIARTVPAHAESAAPSRGLIALPGNAAIAVADGAEGERPDVAFFVDLDGGAPIRLASATRLDTRTPGLGTGAYDPVTRLVLIPAGRNRVLRRRVREIEGATVLCPGDERCPPDDGSLSEPIDLCNRLVVQSVRLVGTMPHLPMPLDGGVGDAASGLDAGSPDAGGNPDASGNPDGGAPMQDADRPSPPDADSS